MTKVRRNEMPERQSAGDEPLSGWRRVVAQAREEERYRRPLAEEAYVLRVLKILLWILGLSACFLLAWQGTGESVIVTTLILLLPIAAWCIFGLSRWALILPISLIAALALQGALLLA
jgi:hypothetical protein